MRSVFKTLGNVSPTITGSLALAVFCTPMKRSPTDFASTDLPAPEEIKIPFNNGVVQAYAWGEGPTVLFVHGWESSAARYAHFVEPMLAAGFRVVLLDGHAHGNSTGKQTNYWLYGDSIRATIRQVGPVYALVGHSFGGGSSVSMLDRYPDVTVQRVVLVASMNDINAATRLFASMVALPEKAILAMQDHIARYCGRPFRALDVDYVAPARTEDALIIHDEQDQITSFESSKAVAEAWPHATLYPTRGLGHRRILKDPAVVEQIVSFLAEGVCEREVVVG